MPSYKKDPSSELDYSVDWSLWLAEGDTIVDSEWEVSPGLTQPKPPTPGDTTVTVWLGGGEAGQTYPVVCRVTTEAERKAERTFYIKVEEL